MTDVEGLNLESARDSYLEEQERTKRELSEMDILVRQSTMEVERLAQRELTVTNHLRDLEVNLERYGKPEIKNICTTAQEVRMRLQVTKSQLEQHQYRQNALRDKSNKLTEMVTLLNSLIGNSGGGGDEETAESQEQTSQENLIADIIQSQEEERRRISIQMHDGPAQQMSNLVVRAEICLRMIDRDIDQSRSELTGLKTAINSTLQVIRGFIFDLRPMTLEDLGLIPTLRRFSTEFGEKNSLEVNLMVQDIGGRLPMHYEVTIFRFVQEALNNVAKHANATQARVFFSISEGLLQVVVEDNGGGFHVNETLADRSKRRNMGISSMRQQIEVLLRGEFGIESTLGRGTRVAAAIPLP